MKTVFAIILACLCSIVAHAEDERIYINATINSHAANLIFDSGTTDMALFSNAASRFDLKINKYTNLTDKVLIGYTEECSFNIWGTSFNSSFHVVDIPSYEKIGIFADGLLGWSTISNNVVLIDAIAQATFFLPSVPRDITTWTQFRLKTNSDILVLEIPNDKGMNITMAVDTGSFFGIELGRQKWREWKSSHKNQPFTIENEYTPYVGWRTKEESWADKISIGQLALTDVPVSEDISTNDDITLGLAALKRMDIIIDGKHGVAYMRPKMSSSLPYQHNRLGADFASRNSQSDDLIAQVANGSPAYQAGIRNGDMLLAIDGYDETKWRTDTNPPAEVSPLEKPAGTKLELTLKRGDKIFKTTAVLRNILPPDVPKNSN